MPDTVSYRTQTDIQRLEKLRLMEKELPLACTDFFRSISQTTSTLTRLAYAYDFRLFFQYLCQENPLFADTEPRLMDEKDFAKVKARDIDGFQDYLTQYYVANAETGESHVVQNHELGIMRKLCSLRSLFGYLFKNGMIEANVATLVSLPKIHEKPILRLETDEMKKMLDTVYSGDGLSDHQKKVSENTKVRDLAIILLFLGTGIRVSECVGINLDDIDLNNKAFVVTRKGGDQSMLYLPDEVAAALEEYLAIRATIIPVEGHESALFLSLQRKRITQRAVQNLVKKYALIAAPLKKRISPHKLRSTFGTNLYEETGDIYLVADVLGHNDVNTTRKHYAAMSEQHKKEAAKRIQLPVQHKKEE